MRAFITKSSPESDSIGLLLRNLKQATACNTPEELVSSYTSSKIEIQRTFHLKLLMTHSTYKSSVLSQLGSNNQEFKSMIDELALDFKTFTIQESIDFLNWYRRTISSSSPPMLSPEQFQSISKYSKENKMKYNHKTYMCQHLLNLSAFSINNENLKENLIVFEKPIFNSNEILLIFKSFIYNPWYFNRSLFENIDKFDYQIITYIPNLNQYLKIHKYYSAICREFSQSKNSKFLKDIENVIISINSRHQINSIIISRFFLEYNQELHEFYLNKAFDCFREYEPNIMNLLTLAHSLVFSEQRNKEKIRIVMESLFELINNSQEDFPLFKSKTVFLMAKSQISNSAALSKCLKIQETYSNFYVHLLRVYFSYPEITGKSLMSLEMFKKYQNSIKDCYKSFDFIYLADLFNNLIDLSAKNEFAQEVKSAIQSEIISRASRCPATAIYYSKLLKFQFVLSKRLDHLELAKKCEKFVVR